MNRKAVILIVILMILLTGCTTAGSTEMVETALPTAMPTVTKTPQPSRTPTLTIQERITLTPGMDGALTIEEHPFAAREDYELVLAQYEDAEWTPRKSQPTFIVLNGEIISYREEINPADDEIEEVFLRHGQALIYRDNGLWMTIPIGTIKAGSIVYGIYSDGESWYLEVDRGEAFYREDGTLISPILGDIYRDGVSLNESEGYDECFGFSILNGIPFYFFVRDGAYYYHYDGVDYPLNYTHIIHHMCCGGSMAEPRAFEDGMVFFADRGDQRYLVFIGDF